MLEDNLRDINSAMDSLRDAHRRIVSSLLRLQFYKYQHIYGKRLKRFLPKIFVEK